VPGILDRFDDCSGDSVYVAWIPADYKMGEFVHLDVRPAIDTPSAALDRMRVACLRWSMYFSSNKEETQDSAKVDTSTNKSD